MIELDEHAGKVAANFVAEIFKDVYKGTKGVISSKSKELDFLNIAAKKYGKKMYSRYNIIRVFGMSEPIPLKDLFVYVNILEKVTRTVSLNQSVLMDHFKWNDRTFGKIQHKIPAIQAYRNYNKIIVLGKPGAGKTTFLKWLAFLNIDNSTILDKKALPIFISLKEFGDSNCKIIDFIEKQFRICDLPDSETFVNRLITKGKCLILFDGLDEVKENSQEQVIQEIIDFSDQYSDNKFVISCRVAVYNHWFQHFVDIEIADFEKKQIELFIDKWFKSEKEIGKKCWNELSQTKQFFELAKTPLLLTLLCIVYDSGNSFPPNRGELYNEAINALLQKWDSIRRIKRDEVYRSLSLQRKKNLLSTIAATCFDGERYFFKLEYLGSIADSFLEKLPSLADDYEEGDKRGEEVIKSIQRNHGIIVQRAKGEIYSFSHLTFQEYFTALYFKDKNDSKLYKRLIENYLTEANWREVFRIISEMLSDGDSFIGMMYDYTDSFINENTQLFSFLKKINDEVENDKYKFEELLLVLSLIMRRISNTPTVEQVKNDILWIIGKINDIGFFSIKYFSFRFDNRTLIISEVYRENRRSSLTIRENE